MSDETKRDVLEKLIECYAEVSDAYTEETGSPYYCDDEPDYIDEYDTALPDDLPVIPEAVGNEIIEDQGEHLSDELHWAAQMALGDRKLSNWITENENTFARAWVLGVWRVEETGEIVKLEAEK